MTAPTISIIATFYNNRKTAKKLIKSVFAQTYTDWELICIDDCSPQCDFEIINNFGGGKIRVIRNSHNIGANPSRKIGIDNARGKYLTFIDGDDWFEPNALEQLIKPALKYNLDYVQMHMNRVYPPFFCKKVKNNIELYNVPLEHKLLIDKYFITFFGINLLNVGYVGKLYNTEIVKNLNFSYYNYPIGEDLLFSVHLFPTLQSAMFIDYYGYNYRFGGITSSEHSIPQVRKIIIDFIELYRIKSKFAQEINYEKAYRPMFVELKNILLSNFSCIAKYKSTDARAIEAKNVISEILNIKDYSDNISSLLHHERYANDNFIKAISNNDIETIYKISHANYKKDWKKRLLKRCLRLFS